MCGAQRIYRVSYPSVWVLWMEVKLPASVAITLTYHVISLTLNCVILEIFTQ